MRGPILKMMSLMVMSRLCRPQMESDRLSILHRLQQLEDAMEQGRAFIPAAMGSAGAGSSAGLQGAGGGPVGLGQAGAGQAGFAGQFSQAGQAGQAGGAEASPRRALPDAVPEDIQEIRSKWKSIISDVSSIRFRSTLATADLKFSTAPGMENRLIVQFPDFLGETWTKAPEQPAQELASLIAEKTGRNVQIQFLVANDHSADQSQLWSVDSVLETAKRAINMDIEIEEE